MDRTLLNFVESNWHGTRKLRGLIRGGPINFGTANFGITATTYRQVFLSEGLDAVSALQPADGRIHVRIGLSRPFAARPNECFVQINGIYAILPEHGG
jgi:hypothetical protein